MRESRECNLQQSFKPSGYVNTLPLFWDVYTLNLMSTTQFNISLLLSVPEGALFCKILGAERL